jgi:hypothetical protein
MTKPEDRRWQLGAPGRQPERHEYVLYLGCNVLRTSEEGPGHCRSSPAQREPRHPAADAAHR